MEESGLVHRENNAVGGVTGFQKWERNSKIASLTASAMGRTRLSDITNLASNGRTARSIVAVDQENAKAAAPLASSKDYIAQLLKENSALVMLLGERNKIIELSGIEIQKLRFALQKSNQQNHLLARANTQMLAEHNLDKDRLKALHHELGCMEAVLKAKTLELEEKNKLIKQLREIIGPEKIMEGCTELNNILGDDAPVPASRKRTCNSNRKCTMRNQSLCSATMAQHVTAKEKDESRRKSLRRRTTSVKNEPAEDLFEIEDVSFPIRLVATDPMHEASSGQVESSAPPVVDSITRPVNEEHKDQNGSLKNENQVVQIKFSIGSLASGPMQEERSVMVDSSAPSISDAISDLVKEEQDWKRSPQNQNQGVRRSSVGRPMRRAAEKVSSYKEVPLNVKMRRAE